MSSGASAFLVRSQQEWRYEGAGERLQEIMGIRLFLQGLSMPLATIWSALAELKAQGVS